MGCKCGMREKMVGDGCIYCNTEHAVDIMPTDDDLLHDFVEDGFSEDQSYAIIYNVYGPLMSLVKVLVEKTTAQEKMIRVLMNDRDKSRS